MNTGLLTESYLTVKEGKLLERGSWVERVAAFRCILERDYIIESVAVLRILPVTGTVERV